MGAVPSGRRCPLTRHLCIQRILFIPPLTLSPRKPLGSSSSVYREHGLLGAGRHGLRRLPLALVGHVTRSDPLSLEEKRTIAFQLNGPALRPAYPLPGEHRLLALLPALHEPQLQLWADQAVAGPGGLGGPVRRVHSILSPSRRGVWSPGREASRMGFALRTKPIPCY